MQPVSNNPFSARRKLIIQVAGPAGADAETGAVDEQVRFTFSYWSRNGEAYPGENLTRVGRWLSTIQRTAVWEFSRDVSYWSNDSMQAGDRGPSNCKLLVEGFSSRTPTIPRWFQEIDLGVIAW
jgi:hypothetical protein